MNNLLIIVLPALALGGFAYGVWQRQMARHDAERAFEKRYAQLQEDYRKLQVDHGVDLARADGLAQEVEHTTEERDEAFDLLFAAGKHRDRVLEDLHVANQEIERLVAENDGLAQERDKRGEQYIDLQEAIIIDAERAAQVKQQRDELNRENEKLHAQVKLLIETANKQPIEEKGHVDEDTLGTTTQTSPKPRTARQRKAT